MADARPEEALVHVLLAELPRVRRRAQASVALDPVHAAPAVLAVVPRAVVYVLLAVHPPETGRTFAFVIQSVDFFASATVTTWRRIARYVLALAVFTRITRFTDTRVGSMGVEAFSFLARRIEALVDVVGAGGAGKPGGARALIPVIQRLAGGAVAAWLRRAEILPFTMTPGESGGAGAVVGVEGAEGAGAAVLAGLGVARVLDGDLAEGGREPDRARAEEARARLRRGPHVARPAVLAPRARTRVARVQVLTVLPHVHRRAVAVGFASWC